MDESEIITVQSKENKDKKMLNTPVLLLIFNRPDTTQLVFNEIRKAKPKQLFIAADGPRKDHLEDAILCQKTRAIIDQVDWDCKVTTLFRNENLGCKIGVSSAIDWFFSQVDAGIIVEDDRVPNQSFFWFCQELLQYYRNDTRILMISGTNYFFNTIEMDETYYFSRTYGIGAWATWRRAWTLYDINMSGWSRFNSEKYLEEIYNDKKIVRYFQVPLQMTYLNLINTWDYQWVYTCIRNNGLAICPKYNLISDIGTLGVHMQNGSRFHFMPVKELDVEKIIHPNFVIPNFNLDKKCFKILLRDHSLPNKILGKFNRIINFLLN